MPPPNYENLELALWQRNLSRVVQDLRNNDPGLSKKIDSFARRFNYARVDIENEIRNPNNPMFAAAFAKSPSRTDFDKRAAKTWLDNELRLQFGANAQVTRLPQRGAGVLYIAENGDIRPLIAGEKKPSKALNFSWEILGITYYAMHKYTSESGGAQDTQFREEQRMLDHFNSPANTTNHNNVLIIIVDGRYYTPAKMRELRRSAKSAPTDRPKSFAVHTRNVPWAIKQCP